MMNMVQSRHKSAFVSPPSRDYSRPTTASQSGSKWPKGSRPKKSTQTCAAQWSMQITAPAAPAAPAPQHIPTSSIPPGSSSSSSGPSEVYSQRCQLKVLSYTHFTHPRRQREKLGDHKSRSDFFIFSQNDLAGMIQTFGGGWGWGVGVGVGDEGWGGI